MLKKKCAILMGDIGKKIKLLSELSDLVLKNSPYFLTDPGTYTNPHLRHSKSLNPSPFGKAPITIFQYLAVAVV